MDRNNEILEFGKTLLVERFVKDTEVIMDEIKQNSFLEDMRRAFDVVFQKGVKQQENGEKGEIAFVTISYLKSSIVTRSYDFLIQLYDETQFYDMTETSGTWSPQYIMGFYERQVDYFEQEVRKMIIRVQKSELLEFERTLAGDYYSIVLGILAEHFEQIISLDSFTQLKKTSEFEIQYGGLYDVTIPLYESRKDVTS